MNTLGIKKIGTFKKKLTWNIGEDHIIYVGSIINDWSRVESSPTYVAYY